MSGAELADALKAISPHQPVVAMSCWGEGMLIDRSVLETFDATLNKPPRISELRRILGSIASRSQIGT